MARCNCKEQFGSLERLKNTSVKADIYCAQGGWLCLWEKCGNLDYDLHMNNSTLTPAPTVPGKVKPACNTWSAGWEIEFSELLWSELEKLHARNSAEEADEFRAASRLIFGPLFAEDQIDGAFVVIVVEHDGEKNIECSLKLIEPLPGEPPANIIELSKGFGWKAGGYKLLTEFLLPDDHVIAEYEIRLEVAVSNDVMCPFLPTPKVEPDHPVAGIGEVAIQEAAGYDIQNGVFGISNLFIAYYQETQSYSVVVTTRAPIGIKDDSFLSDYVSEVAQFTSDKLFRTNKNV